MLVPDLLLPEPFLSGCVMVRLIGWLVCWVTGIGLGLASASAPDRVLFIAVDDLRDWTTEFGSVRPVTPHLDRLVAEGVHFRRAYCQVPLCNPSRASVLTGLRPDRIGVFDLQRHFRENLPTAVTLPQHFRNHGWRSVRIGKLFHYNVPAGIGTNGLDDPVSWDEVVKPIGRDVRDEARIINPTPERPISAALSWLAAEGRDEEQTDGRIATEAIRLLGEARDQPLFLGVGFFRPHTPFVAPRAYFELYPLDRISLPNAPANDRDDIPESAFAHNNPTPNYGLDERTCREAMQAYLACVSFIDAQVGRLLQAIDESGLRDRTVVALWSDHGYHLGEHLGVWQKRTLFEESARAPLVIRAPNRQGNGHPSDRVVEFIDLFPTITELCELPPPAGLQGRSLVPLLDRPDAAWDSAAVTQVLRPIDSRLDEPVMGRSLRTERWRYTQWNGGLRGEELYDHHADPHEFVNLANEARHKETKRELARRLDQSARSDPPPTTDYDPARL